MRFEDLAMLRSKQLNRHYGQLQSKGMPMSVVKRALHFVIVGALGEKITDYEQFANLRREVW